MNREPVSIIDMYTERTGNVTVAHISAFVGSNLVNVRGAAIRHPDDRFDPVLGSALATARAMESLNRRVARYSSGLVKHQENAVRSAVTESERRAEWEARVTAEDAIPQETQVTTTDSSVFNTVTTVTDKLRSFTEVVDSIRDKVMNR